MKKYRVTFEDPNPETQTVEVEASTELAAIAKATNLMKKKGDGEWLYNHTDEVR